MKNVEQMALLNCLMYYDIDFEKGYTLGELIDEIRSDDERWNDILVSKPGVMNKDKTKHVIDAIMYDGDLRNMLVIASTSNQDGGPVNVCLVDKKNKDAVFCFRGTNGAEWLDNAEGFLKESSKLQKDALTFFNSTVEKFKLKRYGYGIDVTGHSKGGNKAQYITIMNPNVRKCYSFEGQGFSLEFVQKNMDKIQERKNKITTYAADMDYVNALGYDIAGQRVFYETNKPKENVFNLQYTMPVVDRLLSHSPGAYIHFQNGKIKMNKETKQSKLSNELNKMSIKMMQEDKADKYGYFMSMMGAIQNMHSCEPIVGEYKMPTKKEIKYGMQEAIDYMMKNGASNALIYILANSCFKHDEEKHRKDNIPNIYTPLKMESIKRSDVMPYTIEVEKIQDSELLKGMASVTFDDKIKIENIGIIENSDNVMDVLYPQYKKGNEYISYFRPINKEFEQELRDNILYAYKNGKCNVLSDREMRIVPEVNMTERREVAIEINNSMKIEKIRCNEDSDLIMPKIIETDTQTGKQRKKELCSIVKNDTYEDIKNMLSEQLQREKIEIIHDR